MAAPPFVPQPSRLCLYSDASAPAPKSRTVSVDEAAALLGVSRNTVYRSVRDGTLGAASLRVGRRVLVSRADVDRLLVGQGAR
ncbi:MAG: helix-turn-helix domain-containing protein [Chloroflexota bacterium]|nr:helix-turn-helix domain-containing protein [Chloroflexota bacterium]